MSRRNRVGSSGFTIIELLISLTIMVIIIGVIFSFFIFNMKSFKKGEDLSIVQSDVRMAAAYVTEELRNVNNVSLTLSTLPNALDTSLLHTKFASVNNATFLIKQEGIHYVIEFSIQGNDATMENEYTLDSNVLMNNITSSVIGSGNTLYYQKEY